MLVGRIGDRPRLDHVQRDAEALFVRDLDLRLRQIGRDVGVPGDGQPAVHVVALQPRQPQAAHLPAHVFGVHIGRDQHRAAPAGVGGYLGRGEGVLRRDLLAERADRAGQNQAAIDATAGQQLGHPAPVRGQIDDVFLQLPERVVAGRGQVRLRPQVHVGVADRVRHEAVQLAPEELKIGFSGV